MLDHVSRSAWRDIWWGRRATECRLVLALRRHSRYRLSRLHDTAQGCPVVIVASGDFRRCHASIPVPGRWIVRACTPLKRDASPRVRAPAGPRDLAAVTGAVLMCCESQHPAPYEVAGNCGFNGGVARSVNYLTLKRNALPIVLWGPGWPLINWCQCVRSPRRADTEHFTRCLAAARHVRWSYRHLGQAAVVRETGMRTGGSTVWRFL